MTGFLIVGTIIVIIIACVVAPKKIQEENEKLEAEYDEHFKPTEVVSAGYGLIRYIEVDMSNKRWRINNSNQVGYRNNKSDIYEFKDLRDFELLEKSGGSYTKATTAPTMLGAALGVVNSTKTYAQTTEYLDMKIRVSFKDLSVPDQYIVFGGNQKGSSTYKVTYENIERCLSLLRKIKAYNEENAPVKKIEQSNNRYYVADEILKLKSLLDEGIITQEEFDAQKSKLL